MPPAATTGRGGDGVHDARDQGQGGDFSGHVAARLDALRDDDVHPRGGRPAGIRDGADLMEDLHARRMGTPHVRRRITPEQGEDGHPLFQADGDLILDGEVESRFTPNGLAVSARTRRISWRKTSGEQNCA